MLRPSNNRSMVSTTEKRRAAMTSNTVKKCTTVTLVHTPKRGVNVRKVPGECRANENCAIAAVLTVLTRTAQHDCEPRAVRDRRPAARAAQHFRHSRDRHGAVFGSVFTRALDRHSTGGCTMPGVSLHDLGNGPVHHH